MKRICLVIHSLGLGGMERVMSQLADYFVKEKKAEVHLVLIGKRREIRYELPDEIRVYRPDFEFNNKRRNRDTFRTMLFLRNQVKQIRPDVVLSFGEYWNNLVLMALKGLEYPVYVSDRSQPEKDLGRIHNYLRKTLYKRASGYIAQTEAARKACLKNRWNENIIVTGNPIRNISNGEQKKREKIVLSVGRLIPTKHLDRLITMFSEVRQPGWKLIIVGGDAKKMNISQELRRIVSDLNFNEHVVLAGEQKNVDEYYKRSRIFAFTSSSEGFPNVVGEALSAGLPVISYDCVAGPADMITDGENGFLIPLFDENTFKEKLKLLMTDDSLRKFLSENASRTIDKYDVGSISEEIYQFIMGASVKQMNEVMA